MLPYKDVEQAEQIKTSISPEMQTALDTWYSMYLNQAEWLADGNVKSLNLPALICSEVARQITLEMKWSITGRTGDGGEDIMNPRAEYLKSEFEKLIIVLRSKLEQGLAAGGMAIKPYVSLSDGHIYFSFDMDWGLYPMAFNGNGDMSDVIFRDIYTEKGVYFTRLERHTVAGNGVDVTQRVFKSNMRDSLGTEITLSEVDVWKDLEPEITLKNTNGQMFGWYKVASANMIDPESPIGASLYSKAVDAIKEADMQYSRMLWEYEGSELAIDVDPNVLKSNKADNTYSMPKLSERLFRGVDLGQDETYNVFNPSIRDTAYINGLNELLKIVENLCGLARGTLSDANLDARTATELNMIRQRTYATINDNQKALERCLRDVVRVMDYYATLYKLAPEGDYDVSFEWDDSVITDVNAQLNERVMLCNIGVISKSELREWYFGETPAQADAAIQQIQAEQIQTAAGLAAVSDVIPSARTAE